MFPQVWRLRRLSFLASCCICCLLLWHSGILIFFVLCFHTRFHLPFRFLFKLFGCSSFCGSSLSMSQMFWFLVCVSVASSFVSFAFSCFAFSFCSLGSPCLASSFVSTALMLCCSSWKETIYFHVCRNIQNVFFLIC